MRIGFITNSVITKHATMKRAFGLTPGLQARGCRVTICLEDHADNRAAIERLKGCRAHYYHRGTLPREYRQKAEFIANCDCDVVHICGLGWRNALMRRGTAPAIVMDHVELESSLPSSSFLRARSQAVLEWASLLAYRNTVMASDFLENLFKRRAHGIGLSRRMVVLPYASDAPNPDGMRGASQIKGSRQGRRIILYMGGLYKNYGCLDIVNALGALLKHGSDWDAILLGRGPEETIIHGMLERLGLKDRVEMPGYATGKTLDAYLAAADVFLSPLSDTVADWARCPGKTYIYMMHRRPIVTCRVGETYKALGADGFYYRPGDIESMTEAVRSALAVGEDWRPTYDPQAHTWDARAETYLRWLRSWHDAA
jgi:glycosyltransferase involved in cell wall biosynthesis